MQKILSVIFLFVLMVANTAMGATYNCRAQNIEQGKTHYDAAGKKTVSLDNFKTDIDKNDKYIVFSSGAYSYNVLVCGHEKVDGCEKYETVAVLGKHKIAKISDVTGKDVLGLYRCSGTHSWEKASTKYITKCKVDVSGLNFISKTSDGINFYCQNEVHQVGDTKYCSNVCYSDVPAKNANAGNKKQEQKKTNEEQPVQTKINVTGNVRDATETLPMANVVVLNPDGSAVSQGSGEFGTATDNNGNFSLKNVPTNGKLKISFVGYKTQIVSVGPRIDVLLVPESVVSQDVEIAATKSPCGSQGGTWDNDKNTCKCPNGRFWDSTHEKCYTICDFLNAGNTVDGIDAAQLATRKACCGYPEATAKWIGNLKTGHCECQGENVKWENNSCGVEPKVENSPSELQCDANKNLKLNTEKTNCICKDGYEEKDGNCIEKTVNSVVNDNQNNDEKICIDAGGTWGDNICTCGDTAKWQNGQCVCVDEISVYNPTTNQCEIDKEKEDEQRLSEKQDAYDAAKETEQSTANKMLGGLTTAATGLGGMELAMGLAQQKADRNAADDMNAYIETFRCTYGNEQSVKGGIKPIELPGGNDAQLMALRNEYFELAATLKERKESLGLKLGIESEEILDKSQIGLYDDESLEITNGKYASLYRANMGDAEDQAKIDEEKEKSAKRVKYGGVAVGAGVVGGIAGNALMKSSSNKDNLLGTLAGIVGKDDSKSTLTKLTGAFGNNSSDALDKIKGIVGDSNLSDVLKNIDADKLKSLTGGNLQNIDLNNLQGALGDNAGILNNLRM